MNDFISNLLVEIIFTLTLEMWVDEREKDAKKKKNRFEHTFLKGIFLASVSWAKLNMLIHTHQKS